MNLLVLAFLGLALGSFVNALVFRLRMQSKQSSAISYQASVKAGKNKQKPDYSILHGRSMCTSCHHKLAWYDLIPVMSWVMLGGMCRYCKNPISIQYPLVELATAALFIISYTFWPYSLLTAQDSLLFALWLVFLVGFVAMAVYDLRWMILPNRLTYIFTGLAVIQVILRAIIANDMGVIASALAGLVAVGGLFYLLFQVSDGKWIGGGDVKLGFMLGLLAGGFVEGLVVVFVASLIGTVIGVPILVLSKQNLKQHIPFGPLLIIALIIVYLFGASLIAWYQNHLLLI